MVNRSILVGSLFAMVAVVLGAFGAHGLKENPAMTTEYLQVFDTGVRYQFYHAFALIIMGILAKVFGETKTLYASMWFFCIGILFFSGSIYLLSTRAITGLEWNWLGPITPVGGLCFIAGWILIAISFTRKKN